MEAKDIFISYSSNDVEIIGKLHGDLAKNGFSVWRDKTDIRADHDWAKSIDAALRSVKFMILAISKSSMQSDEVYREWSFFISRGKPIICIWLEEADVHFRLFTQQRIDFRSPVVYEDALNRLTGELHLLMGQDAVAHKVSIISETGEIRAQQVLGWNDLAQVTKAFTRQMLDIRYTAKFDPSYYLQRQSIVDHFRNFIASDKVVMVLTGKAGTGKSSFICSINGEKTDDYMILLQDCAHLELPDEMNIENYLERVLGIKTPLIKTLKAMHENDPSRKIVFLFDAVNEFKDRETLLVKLSQFISSIDTPAIKVFITARIPVWNSVKRSFSVPLEHEFHTSGPNSYVNIDSFSDEEIPQVYALYKKIYKLQREFKDLNQQVKYFLKQPLFLKLTAEAYGGKVGDKAMPRTLVLRDVFTAYIESCLGDEGLESDEYQILAQAIQLMYAEARRELELNRLQNDPQVGAKIASVSYKRLVDRGMLSERGKDESVMRKIQMVFVTYERVFEFLLADITINQLTVQGIEEQLDLAKSKSFVQLRGALELAVGFSIIKDKKGIKTLLELAHHDRPDTRQFLVDVIQVIYDSGHVELASEIIDDLYEDDDEEFGTNSKLLAAQAAYQLRFDDKLVNAAISKDLELRETAAIFIYLRWHQARLAGNVQDGYEPIRQLASKIQLIRPDRAVRALSTFIALAIHIVPHAMEDVESVRPLIAIAQDLVRKVPGLKPNYGSIGIVGDTIIKAVAQSVGLVFKNFTRGTVFDKEDVMESFFTDIESHRAFVDCNLLMDRENLLGSEETITRFINWPHMYVYWLVRFPMLYHMTYQPEIHQGVIQGLIDNRGAIGRKGRISLAWAMTYGYTCRALMGESVSMEGFSAVKDNFINLWFEIQEDDIVDGPEYMDPHKELANVLYGILITEVVLQRRTGKIIGSDFLAEMIGNSEIDWDGSKVSLLLDGLEQIAYLGYPDFCTITILGPKFRTLWKKKAPDYCIKLLASLRAFYQEEIDSLIISYTNETDDDTIWNELRVAGSTPKASKVFSASAVLWPLLDATTPAFLKVTSQVGFDLCQVKSIPELFEKIAKVMINSLFDLDGIHVFYYIWYSRHVKDWDKFERFTVPREVKDPNFKPELQEYSRQLVEGFVKVHGMGHVSEVKS